MRTFLFIGRIVIFTSLALICGLPALSTEAAAYLPGASVPEFMGGQPASGDNAPTTVVVPVPATWVDDIMNALGSYFKTNDPTFDFTSYLKRLTLARDAENRGDRRTVEVEMGAFFTMLTNQSLGISEGTADEVANFARALMPAQEYGIFFPKGPEQYWTPAPWFGSEQERRR
jgi:hypothetical protein